MEIVAAILEEGNHVRLNPKHSFVFGPLQVVAFLLREGHYSQDGRLVDIARLAFEGRSTAGPLGNRHRSCWWIPNDSSSSDITIGFGFRNFRNC
jgi:hypothetical protein